MIPQHIELTDDDEAELDRIAEEIGREMWQELGLTSPPDQRPAPEPGSEDEDEDEEAKP